MTTAVRSNDAWNSNNDNSLALCRGQMCHYQQGILIPCYQVCIDHRNRNDNMIQQQRSFTNATAVIIATRPSWQQAKRKTDKQWLSRNWHSYDIHFLRVLVFQVVQNDNISVLSASKVPKSSAIDRLNSHMLNSGINCSKLKIVPIISCTK